MVVDTDLARHERGGLLEALHDALPVALDLLVYTPTEFTRGMATGLDVFAAIAAEGRTIYPVKAESEPT